MIDDQIPSSHLDLLADETRAFAYLATTMNDNTPQVTPVWFNMDGKFILINSALGRTKDKNMRARPFIALAIQDPKNPYRYLQIRGKVVSINSEGGREHINALSLKYRDNPKYDGPENETRVTYKILPSKVHAH